MTEHSQEPWSWTNDPNDRIAIAYLESPAGIVLSTAHNFELSPSAADAARIVACVNACAGISTHILESPAFNPWLRSMPATQYLPLLNWIPNHCKDNP
jgi:hypothetical protein